MRRARFLSVLVTCALVFTGAPTGGAPNEQTANDWTRFVDPLIGTYPPGFVNPGPVLPHGMVGLGPDTEGPLNYGGSSQHRSTASP
jgi:hypothetical protein